MKMTHSELQSLSEEFAHEAVRRLSEFSKNLLPDPGVEPVKELWNDQSLTSIFRVVIAEALLSWVSPVSTRPRWLPVLSRIGTSNPVKRARSFEANTTHESFSEQESLKSLQKL